MARISFEQFSSGLPVRRQSEIDLEAQRQNQPPTFMQDANQDRLEMGSAINETLDKSKGEQTRIRDRVTAGEISPVKGAFQQMGTGLLRGGEVLSEAGMGFAKMALPQSVETRIKETLGKDLAEIFDPKNMEKFRANLEQPQKGGVVPGTQELNQKIADGLKIVLDTYENDETFRTDVNSSIGILNTIGALLGSEARAPRKTGSLKVEGVGMENYYNPAQTIPITNRTAQQAAEEVVAAANPSKQGNVVTDTIAGATQQVKDFAGRTIRSAQDTAEQNRRLSTLPVEEATLIRKGADERVVNVIKQAPAEEVAVYKELMEQAKRKEIDPTPNTAQPKQIAGREFLKPVEHIITARDGAGKRLGEFRKNLTDTKNVNTNPAFRNFHQNLKDKYGVQFDKNGQIIKGKGILPEKDIVQVQKLYDELRSKTVTSQKDIDEFLRRSLEEYDITQQREKAFSNLVSEVAESARYEMRQLMPDGYNRAATQYAQLSKPLEETAKLLGFKGKVSEITAKDLKAGEVALRILGNASDRPQSVIDEVLKVAKENGYTSNVDLNRLIYVTDQLEDLYDITPSRGFSGSTQRGIDQSAAGTVGDVATMNVGGLFNRVAGSQATRQEVKEAFEAYINSL